MNRAPRICFIEGQGYGVLDSQTRKATTGGESVQHALLAQEFVTRGWTVSMVSRDIGQQDGKMVNGVKVWKTYRQDAGLPYLRFFYPRLTSIWRALGNADADIYFQSCAGLMTGVVARFVSLKDRKMIFRIAHDSDCVPGEQLIGLERDRRIYDYGLRRAHMISAQSKRQADTLFKNYGLKSHEVFMAAEIPPDPVDSERDIDVLWVNNFRGFKRPELVIDIAKHLPETTFTIIGGKMKGFEDIYDEVEKGASELPNVDFVGAVPYSEVNSYFTRAKLFLNTSDSEGFPNSFLQAWVRRVPVVSYFDPDGLINDRKLGVAVSSQANFHEALGALLSDNELRREMGARARQFVIDTYSASAAVDVYEKLFADHLHIKVVNE